VDDTQRRRHHRGGSLASEWANVILADVNIFKKDELSDSSVIAHQSSWVAGSPLC
jgi:hypothetical protein